jgi:hypothetical protein
MAQVVSRNFASVLSIYHGVCQESPVWTFAIEWMLGDVSACWVYLDSIHRIIMDSRLGFAINILCPLCGLHFSQHLGSGSRESVDVLLHDDWESGMGAFMDDRFFQADYATLDFAVDNNPLGMVTTDSIVDFAFGNASHAEAYLPSFSSEKRATDPPEAHGAASSISARFHTQPASVAYNSA